jgi:hypothetical protein
MRRFTRWARSNERIDVLLSVAVGHFTFFVAGQLRDTPFLNNDSDGLNHWQLLIQKYFEFLSGLVSWVGDVWIF